MRLIVPLLLAAGAIAPGVAHARAAQPGSAKATHAPRTAQVRPVPSNAMAMGGAGNAAWVGGAWTGMSAFVASQAMTGSSRGNVQVGAATAGLRPVSPE